MKNSKFSSLQKITAIYKARSVSLLSASLAYYMLFAVFPTMALTLVITNSLFDNTSAGILEYVPSFLKDLLGFDAVKTPAAALGSILLSVFSLVKFIRVLKHHLDAVNDDTAHRCFGKSWAFSSLMAVYFLFILYLSAFTLVFGESVLRVLVLTLGKNKLFVIIWDKMRILFALALMIFFLLLVFRFLPEKKCRVKKCMPGVLFTAVVWLVSTSAFSLYVKHFSTHSVLYGPLSTIIVVMIWFYLLSNIILIGACINLAFS